MNKLAVRFAAAALVAGVASFPAQAQVAANQVTPGMQVYDTKDALVGAVAKVGGGMVTVDTGEHAVPVNPASFALDHGRLYLSMNRAELNAYYETNVMAADASLGVGKPVKGLGGVVLGTIKQIDDAHVVVTLANGQPIELPRNAIVGAATGATVGISADDLAKQLGTAASAPAAAPTPAAPPAEPAAPAGATASGAAN